MKLISALKKEYLLLARDLPALLIILIMPVVLVVIVTVAQDSAVRNSRETKTEILFVDKGNSAFSRMLEENLDKSGLYKIIKSQGDEPFSESEAINCISKGEVLTTS